jgi:hypothetical protein
MGHNRFYLGSWKEIMIIMGWWECYTSLKLYHQHRHSTKQSL